MPFTPVHMGIGILVKSLLHSAFSLMVFGWCQIVMDIQPLVAIVTGEGKLHGFSHTYVGALILGALAGFTGKYLSEFGLQLLGIPERGAKIKIRWWVAFVSAYIGAFSHIVLDSVMHADMMPFFPLNNNNALLGIVSIEVLHKICLYAGLIGALVYYATHGFVGYRAKKYGRN